MPEFNLLRDYPKGKRKELGRVITPEIKAMAEKLDFWYYDSDRLHGFGGYTYDGRWQAVARLAKERYNLTKDSKVLIDRSDKGFLVFDLKKLIPGITVYGTHPSIYSINHAMEGYGKWALMNGVIKDVDPKIIEQQAREEILPFLIKADAWNLPFKNSYFDTVISINNVCAYPIEECKKAIREVIRVSKNGGKNCYIQNDSWETEEEKQMLLNWTFLCKTFLSTKEWEKLFEEEGYDGDWGFTIIE